MGFAFFLETNQTNWNLRSELGGFGVTHSQIVCELADGTRQIGLVRNLGIVRKNLEKMQIFL